MKDRSKELEDAQKAEALMRAEKDKEKEAQEQAKLFNIDEFLITEEVKQVFIPELGVTLMVHEISIDQFLKIMKPGADPQEATFNLIAKLLDQNVEKVRKLNPKAATAIIRALEPYIPLAVQPLLSA